MKNVLVTSDVVTGEDLARLSKFATVYASWKMDPGSLERILPDVDVLLILSWPGFLNDDAILRMKRLTFVQSILVGVNHVPFRRLPKGILVASNAGAYSIEVSEHAWALLLAAQKRVVEHDLRIRNGERSTSKFFKEGQTISALEGKTLGILGYGSIGRLVAKQAKAFSMNVMAFGRTGEASGSLKVLRGRAGLYRILKASNAVLLSLPLNRSTFKLIGAKELSLMKENAILVNIARGDLVDQAAIFSHLTNHPGFRFATDVWWFKEGRETLETEFPFQTLRNFIGTPHTSGPAGVGSGRPSRLSTDNVVCYLRGRMPLHVVDRADYEGM